MSGKGSHITVYCGLQSFLQPICLRTVPGQCGGSPSSPGVGLQPKTVLPVRGIVLDRSALNAHESRVAPSSTARPQAARGREPLQCAPASWTAVTRFVYPHWFAIRPGFARPFRRYASEIPVAADLRLATYPLISSDFCFLLSALPCAAAIHQSTITMTCLQFSSALPSVIRLNPAKSDHTDYETTASRHLRTTYPSGSPAHQPQRIQGSADDSRTLRRDRSAFADATSGQ
jgi:hypothetical protein